MTLEDYPIAVQKTILSKLKGGTIRENDVAPDGLVRNIDTNGDGDDDDSIV